MRQKYKHILCPAGQKFVTGIWNSEHTKVLYKRSEDHIVKSLLRRKNNKINSNKVCFEKSVHSKKEKKTIYFFHKNCLYFAKVFKKIHIYGIAAIGTTLITKLTCYLNNTMYNVQKKLLNCFFSHFPPKKNQSLSMYMFPQNGSIKQYHSKNICSKIKKYFFYEMCFCCAKVLKL